MSCGGGTLERSRTCLDEAGEVTSLDDCDGNPTEVIACETQSCPGTNFLQDLLG